MANLKHILVAILFLVFPISLFAQEEAFCPPDWVMPNAPSTYVVQPDDTLWDITCTFLKEPWRWDEVCCPDPIDDPNLIYPGDKLHFSYEDGKPRIKVERGHSWIKVNKRTGEVKLSPRVRHLPADNPIPTIAINVIEPFFNKSRVVNKHQAHGSPCIIALDEDHIIVGVGDRIYVTGMSARIQDDVFTVFRPGKDYINPCNCEYLGIEGYVLGTAEREVIGDPSRWLITQSFAEIKVGDRLIATMDEKLDPYFVPRFPNLPAEGQIISVFDGINQIGQYQVIVLTGGKDKCREVGDMLGVFQVEKDLPTGFMLSFERKFDYPPMRVGDCLVFRVFDKVSYALVMDATRTIYLHDYVGAP